MRKNVASQYVAFQAVSTTDGAAVTTGTPAVYYTIDGGSEGTGGGACVHEGHGTWSYACVQAETNGNHVVFTFVLTGAVSQCVNVYPVAYDPSDTVRMGLTALPNAAAAASGGLIVNGTNSGNVELDALSITGQLDAGNLLVDGTTVLTGTVGTGAVTLASLDVTGLTRTGTLTVTGATTLAAVGLTTLTASGAVALQSTLTVTGAVTLSSTLGTGAVTFASTNLGNTTVGTLGVGATTLASLYVTGLTTLHGAVALDSTLAVTGTTTLTGTVTASSIILTGLFQANSLVVTTTTDLTGDVHFGANWHVVGTTQLQGAVTHTGTTTYTGAVSYGSTETHTGALVTNITGNITGNLVGTVSTLTTYTGNTPQTGDSYAIVNGDHGLVSIQDDVDAILADTNELELDWKDGGRLDLLLDGASAAGDPWLTLIPGSYTAGMAGYILGTNINATISSRGTGTALDAAGVRTAVGLATANLDTQLTAISGYVDCLPVSWVVPGIGTSTLTAGDVATALTTALTTTTMAEDYPADGAAATPAELLYLILSCVSQFDITTTSLVTRKLDGTTQAAVYTLDDATSPTLRRRTT